MGADLYGYRPAHRREWDSTGAGGAPPPPTTGGTGGTPRPPTIDEALTSGFFATQTRLYLFGTGRGGPDSTVDSPNPSDARFGCC